jgi:hypothetical protein
MFAPSYTLYAARAPVGRHSDNGSSSSTSYKANCIWRYNVQTGVYNICCLICGSKAEE